MRTNSDNFPISEGSLPRTDMSTRPRTAAYTISTESLSDDTNADRIVDDMGVKAHLGVIDCQFR